MKFSVSSEKFKKIISLAVRVCGNNLTIPILNNVLIELQGNNLNISSTNLEIGLLISLPVGGEKDGKITLPGKIFFDFVSLLPKGEIKIKEKDLAVIIECGEFKAKILGQDPKDFPIIPEVKEENIAEIFSQTMVSSFSKVSHVVSPSDSRVEISGVLMKFNKKKLKLVGTDSIRLSEKSIELQEEVKEKSIIIPQKTALEVGYVFSGLEGSVGVALSPSQISFNFKPKEATESKIILISRLIEGQYPEYEGTIPQKTRIKIFLDKEELQKKIRIASLFSSRIQDVKFKFEPEKESIKIFASSSDVGEGSFKIQGKIEIEEIEKENLGNLPEISFNWKYFLDGLAVIEASEVSFGVNDSSSATVLRPVGDKTYLYLLMPKVF